MHKLLSHCPICSDKLKAAKLKCNSCNTLIDNEFELSKFDYLNNEQLYFIEKFIKCRGNIKEVEKELGISYPTVRAKLDDVIESLGYSTKENKNIKNNKDILISLEKGKISVDEAINKLKY